jgi:hypothetical protein
MILVKPARRWLNDLILMSLFGRFRVHVGSVLVCFMMAGPDDLILISFYGRSRVPVRSVVPCFMMVGHDVFFWQVQSTCEECGTAFYDGGAWWLNPDVSFWQVQSTCEECGTVFGNYFCSICRLYDDEDKQQFHCDGCGLCR